MISNVLSLQCDLKAEVLSLRQVLGESSGEHDFPSAPRMRKCFMSAFIFPVKCIRRPQENQVLYVEPP